MKIKEGYILRQVLENFIVVAVGDAALDFNGVISLNETGAFLWGILEKGATEDELLSALTKEYEIDDETAKSDISAFLQKLQDAEILK